MTHLLKRNFGMNRFRDNKNRKRKNVGNNDEYMELGVRVRKGSKLDKAIQQYRKLGYYVTTIGSGHYSTVRKPPSTLRPALFGGTFHQKNYHHPLRDSASKGLNE